MKFDGFRHPREQVAPITLAGTFRNQPVRLLFYRNPFLGLFFTIGFILLPYVGHQFCNRKKGFNAPAGIQNKRLPLYRCNTNLGILLGTDTYASRRDIWNSVVCSSNTHGMEQLRLALSGERWKDYLEKSAKSQMPEELTKQQYQRMRLCSQTTGLHTSMVKEEENDRALLTSTF
ncbi:hypothetical protein D917_02433 [Trichinella nativa]|uniref:Uncharacterized protein n=1 Tax=Trichinella nativa TaxID=6335 RepID=A0A1Y3EF85_9BILA|nr:hypothetical protein D917_02433 [Trichinella nativa]